MATGHTTLVLPDGAKLAYEILGSYYLDQSEPIVLVCGMSSIRGDWEKLSLGLSKSRPVLLYDHRGIGDSTWSTQGDEELTIELLARDLLALLASLGWKKVSILGYSMGGVIAQQLLLLPHHPTRPTPLPFMTTHILLVGTRSVVLKDPSTGLRYTPPANTQRTVAERIEAAKRVVLLTLDPSWIKDNGTRLEALLERIIAGGNRPPATIVKQGIALRTFDFVALLDRLSRETQILVIHGQLDQVVPFTCSQEITKLIPWAKMVEQGNKPGQVPSLAFGHLWYEYFDAQVWQDVVEGFLKRTNGASVSQSYVPLLNLSSYLSRGIELLRSALAR